MSGARCYIGTSSTQRAPPHAGHNNIAQAPAVGSKRLDCAHQAAQSPALVFAFKSFYTTRQGRLGIGLIMVKQIMEIFGGEAGLTHHEQQGTSVQLSFKVVQRKASVLS